MTEFRVEEIGGQMLVLAESAARSRSSVKPRMFTARDQLQVCDAVICTVAIDVMHEFVWQEWPANVILHDDSVFASTEGRDDNVATIDSFASLEEGMVRAAPPNVFRPETTATHNHTFPKRPLIHFLHNAAITSARPVVLSAALAVIRYRNQSAKSLPGEVGNLVCAPILCGSCYHVGSLSRCT